MKTNRLCLLLSLSLATIVFPDTGWAQKNPKVRVIRHRQINKPNGIPSQRHNSFDQQQMTEFLTAHIDLMDAVCDLEPGQVKKLKLAGKSVIRKLHDDEEDLRSFRTLNIDNALQVKKDSLSDEDTETEVEPETVDPQDDLFGSAPMSLKEVLSDAFWRKAEQSVLQPQQQQTWANHLARQNARLRRTLVARRVAELELDLQLTPDQLPEVTNVVNRIEGGRLLGRFKAGIEHSPPDNPAKTTSVEDLANILTPNQLRPYTLDGTAELDDSGLVIGPPISGDSLSCQQLGVGFGEGLVVSAVGKKSLAASLGILPGDVVDSINKQPVDTRVQLNAFLDSEDDLKSVSVIRDGKLIDLEKS